VEAGLTHGWSAALKGGGLVGTKVRGFFNSANGCGIFMQTVAAFYLENTFYNYDTDELQ
jgi:hypothetical protein